MLAVGDSQDVVLLRSTCGVPSGHGMTACHGANNVAITPRWIPISPTIRAVPLPRGRWRFGDGVAGARVFASRAGVTRLQAAVGDYYAASTLVTVVDAPGAVRIAIEPRPSSLMEGDTVAFRVTARDANDRVVAILPPPPDWWYAIGTADDSGFVRVPMPVNRGPTWMLAARLGTRVDSLSIIVRPRRE